jgi:Effector-associated domain 8/CHAT domain
LSVQLSQPDFRRLTQIVQKLPDFANVRDRRRLVAAAFEGVPKADIILSRLDLDGMPMAVSVDVVRFLSQFGQVADGKEALGVFLNYIQSFTGDEDSAFIQILFHNYSLDTGQHTSPMQDNSHLLASKTILLLGSNPLNQARLRLDKEVREIGAGLQRSRYRDRYNLQQVWAVRVDELRRALLDFHPEIVHFCGHGSGTEGIVLENDIGEAQLVSTEAIAGLFKLFARRGVECVVLNACYSAIQAEAIAKHINYVIGMSDLMRDDAAIKFAVGFYDAIGAGWSYDEAYELGCNAIASEGIPQELVPKLFTKDANATIVSPDASVEPFTPKFTDSTPNRQPSTSRLIDHKSLGLGNRLPVEQKHPANMLAIEVLVLYSSSPTDKKLWKELEKTFKPLELQGIIKLWDTSKIIAGRNKKDEMEKHLNSARIIASLYAKQGKKEDYNKVITRLNNLQ